MKQNSFNFSGGVVGWSPVVLILALSFRGPHTITKTYHKGMLVLGIPTATLLVLQCSTVDQHSSTVVINKLEAPGKVYPSFLLSHFETKEIIKFECLEGLLTLEWVGDSWGLGMDFNV